MVRFMYSNRQKSKYLILLLTVLIQRWNATVVPLVMLTYLRNLLWIRSENYTALPETGHSDRVISTLLPQSDCQKVFI